MFVAAKNQRSPFSGVFSMHSRNPLFLLVAGYFLWPAAVCPGQEKKPITIPGDERITDIVFSPKMDNRRNRRGAHPRTHDFRGLRRWKHYCE